MKKSFLKKAVRILMILIFVVCALNLLLTLPVEINKRQLAERITQDIDLLQRAGIQYSLSYDTGYKFNSKTVNQELGILNEIATALDNIILLEAQDKQQEMKELASDLISLEKQILILNLNVELLERNSFKDLIELGIDYSNTRDSLERIIRAIVNINGAISNYKDALEKYKQEQINAGKFSNGLWGKTDSEIADMVLNMSQEELAAQLFIWSVNGVSLSQSEKIQLAEITPGGLILMGYNISNENQLHSLTTDILSQNPDLPFFIATDQEGGPVKRVSWDGTAGATSWAKLTQEQLCDLAEERSQILKKGGINLNLAPVVDLSYAGAGFINHRTISSDPAVVTEKAQQFVNCSQELGIVNVLKHYPGHGATGDDSHNYLPIIDKNKQNWLTSDAVPFSQIKNAGMIMIGHLWFKTIDPIEPATTSKVLLTEILRDELNYGGILISDDMNQLHRSTGIKVKDAIVKSLNAGMDIILYVGLPERPENVVNIVVQAIEDKQLRQSEIENKVFRIMLLKRDLY